jgi:hypothetical protein
LGRESGDWFGKTRRLGHGAEGQGGMDGHDADILSGSGRIVCQQVVESPTVCFVQLTAALGELDQEQVQFA